MQPTVDSENISQHGLLNVQEVGPILDNNNTSTNNCQPIQSVPIPINCTIIDDIIQEFSLNKKQSLAFNLIANHLLDS
jgi:hypothetical protein